MRVHERFIIEKCVQFLLTENYMMHPEMQYNPNFKTFLLTARICNCMVCLSKLFSQNTFLCPAIN